MTDVNDSSALLMHEGCRGQKKQRNERGVAALRDLCELESSEKKKKQPNHEIRSWLVVGLNIHPVVRGPKLILWAISRANKS